MNSRVLKIKDGKFVKVLKFTDGLKLCAVDAQPDDHTVCIEKHCREDWIAFIFKLTQDSTTTKYILKANHSSLELVKLDSSDQVDGELKAFWFLKDSGVCSEHYRLRAALDPQQYICIDQNTRVAFFILSDNVQARAEVKDEAN